ncbi:MAG: precorrin-3B C(17)-methyltransferase [Chloroflexi bacterium]|nr:precorrin-3B C(17)-methyltransferase [Chloroflexota bacterium]
MSADQNGQNGKKGKLTLVGIGPGDVKYITPAALAALSESDVIIGYGQYLRQVANLVDQTRVQEFPMGKEQERALEALRLAIEGMKVAIVTGGDAGIYDMAAPVFELLAEMDVDERSLIDVEIIPGITAASMAASMIGSPLAQDFAVISLSDRFVGWDQIERRLDAVAGADMVIALYEPSSKHRPGQLGKAQEVLLRHRAATAPVVVAREVTRADETINVTTLAQMTEFEHDKRTVIIIGNSKSKMVGDWVITPRTY